MKRKPTYKAALFALLFGLIFTGFIQSCKVNRAMSNIPKREAAEITKPEPAKAKKDTIPVKRRVMTEAQFQKFMEDQYLYNYNKFFMPQFQKISDENVVLKKSVAVFSDLFKITKRQKDSIQRNEQSYKQQNFDYQKEVIRLRQAAVNAQTESTATVAKFMDKTDSNIKLLNKLTRGMVIVGSIIVIGFFSLLVTVILLWRKVSLLRRKLDYAS